MARRNAFHVEPATRPVVDKSKAGAGLRIAPSVAPETAEMAAHLGQNPVFQDLMVAMTNEALDKFKSSPLGEAGAAQREAARYEFAALAAIESRIGSIAAEIHLYAPADNTPDR